ncbi:unnamed protein product [Durusdinium trenchii]|uniref:Uncharacterized protein n=1 Tax=Durusdinium trenchii TaxID=1381693 RepID=A0ABP0JUV7_9DINO
MGCSSSLQTVRSDAPPSPGPPSPASGSTSIRPSMQSVQSGNSRCSTASRREVSFKEPRELKDEASEQGLRMQKYLELIEEHPEILERKVYRKRSRDLKATCVTSL